MKRSDPLYREFNIWKAMIRRCTSKKDASYHLYAKRGIKVCDRWLVSFENFITDMGARPSSAHSIERRDNDGDYTPFNCHWGTDAEQGHNRRTNTLNVTAVYLMRYMRRRGAKQADLARVFGVSTNTVRRTCSYRIWRLDGSPRPKSIHRSNPKRRLGVSPE